ncbi:hypothetical protein D6D10_03373 [Aureobasidium pullulans]|uniref:Glutaredoxin-like protein n=2 Tax=Aureobasidium pullulans TaxID=5580 RepID=A0A4S8SE19_AURPU|nr:hypothetical protein D6D28_06406 [Aureobasidium pullulans]THX40578.1 hypothetical protein D6D10_03373 [Aureobasidium pullulans]
MCPQHPLATLKPVCPRRSPHPNTFSVNTAIPTTMFPTLALRNFACRITLFTRSNCKLCSDAKEILSNVWDKRPFEYDEINVMEHSDQKWKNMYEFDTPVIHVDKAKEASQFGTTHEAKKLMHRFKEHEVEKLMDEAMMDAPSSSSTSA